jgi:hypothetical protein
MSDEFTKKNKSYQQKCPISAGAATPVLIAGIATSSVGAATNIGMRTDFFYLSIGSVKSCNFVRFFA